MNIYMLIHSSFDFFFNSFNMSTICNPANIVNLFPLKFVKENWNKVTIAFFWTEMIIVGELGS